MRRPRLLPRLTRLLAAVLVSALPAGGLTSAGALAAAPRSEVPGLLAGAGRAEVTPPVGTAQWGYGDRSCVLNPADCTAQRTGRLGDTEAYSVAFRASEGVHQRLYARAFVLQDGHGDRVALVQADIGAASAALHAAVVQATAELGIDAPRLLIAPTHTHAGPGALHGDPFHFVGFGDVYDPRVVGIVADGIAAAVRQAVEGLAPARAAVGRTEIHGATRNRALQAHLLNDDVDPAADDVNRTLTMLRVDTAGGRPLGTFSTFANHGTVQGSGQLLLSGDNAGYAARLLEAAMAAEGDGLAEGAGPTGVLPIAAWANGEEGDVAPIADGGDAAADGGFAASLDNGRRQAVPALELWRQLADELRDDLDVAAALDVRSMAEGQQAGHDMSATPLYGAGGTCLPTDLPGIGAKCPLAPSGPPPTHMPFHAVRVGDTVWLGLPFEVTTQAGRRIRATAADALAADPTIAHVAVAGLANDYGGYLTTPEEYAAQGYEGQMTWWGPEQQRFVAEAAARAATLLVEERDGAARPPTAPPATDDAAPASDVAAVARTAAGTIVRQPTAEAPVFSWAGGHPGVDRPNGTPFVTLERRTADGRWVPVLVDDDGSLLVTLEDRVDADVWSAHLAVGLPAGAHRFRVTGLTAGPTGIPVPYAAESAVVGG
jgi:neutral ceramidase